MEEKLYEWGLQRLDTGEYFSGKIDKNGKRIWVSDIKKASVFKHQDTAEIVCKHFNLSKNIPTKVINIKGDL